VILPPIITIAGLVILKRLLKKRKAESADFCDIHKDEKNVIFQLLLIYFYVVVVNLSDLIFFNFSSGESKGNFMQLLEAVIGWTIFIAVFFKDLVLISYVDERLNLNFLF
jgi:hypothetical protein